MYIKLEEFKYYPQVFLEGCRCNPYNSDSRLDEPDESDNMADASGGKFNSYSESDHDNN